MDIDIRIPKRGERWRHYKGAHYLIMGTGRNEDGEVVVIYTPEAKHDLYTCRLDRWLQTLDDHSPRYKFFADIMKPQRRKP